MRSSLGGFHLWEVHHWESRVKLKAKTWERDRRQRMDTCYKTLADLLPPHQEGRKRNKVEILLHATKYIRDLHNRTDELFCARGTTAHKEELARLKKLVTQLLSHIQLLSSLLKDAGITVPNEPALEIISPKLWSNKITADVTERYIKDQSKKAEKIKQRNQLKSSSKKNSTSTSKSSEKSSVHKCFAENDKNTIENQENCVNGISNKCDDSKGLNKPTSTSVSVEIQAEDIAVTSATDNALDAGVKTPAKRKNPKRGNKGKVDNKKSSNSSGAITNLPAGALVFSGTKLMPVVTPMSQIASNIVVNQHQPTNPIIFNNGQQSQMIVNQHSSTNPIILSNTQQNQMIVNQHQHANSIILNSAQQNQMIVVHPLQTNQVPNSVISLQNRAMVTAVRNIVPSAPKISRMSSISEVKNVQTLSRGITRGDLANLRSIADTSKIGGHKAILPKSVKTKAITKTTMTYKVPIPAIRKEKSEKNIDTKEVEREEILKGKFPKTRQQKDHEKEKNHEDAKSDKVSLKRLASSGDKVKEPEDKKRKLKENAENEKSVQIKIKSIVEIPATCKTIGDIKQASEDIERDSGKKQNEQVPTHSEHSVDNKSIESDIISATFTEVNDRETLNSSSSELVGRTSKADNKDNQTEDVSQNLKESPEPITNRASILEEAITDTAEVLVDKATSSLSMSPMKATVNEQTIEEEVIISERSNEVCDLDAGFESLLQSNTDEAAITDEGGATENNKILLNLDTNTTTTMKLLSNESINSAPSTSESLPVLPKQNETLRESPDTSKEEELKTLSYNSSSGFIPISSKSDTLHTDLSNDIFASLQVPSSSHNPESISPTAAFLMAFPLVSSLSGKTEVLEEELKEDFKYQSQTPPMLLQIGTMEPNSFKIKSSSTNIPESITTLKSNRVETKSVETIKLLPKMIGPETVKEQFKIPSSTDQLTTRTLTEVANSFPENSTTNITSANVSTVVTINSSSPMINGINESTLIIRDVSSSENNDYSDQIKPQSILNYPTTSKSDILTTTNSTTLSTSVKVVNSTKYDSTSQYLESQESRTESLKDNSIRNPHYEFHPDETSNANTFNSRELEVPFISNNKIVTFSSASEVTDRISPVDKLPNLASSLDPKEKMETQSLNSLDQVSQSSQQVQKITEAMQINLEPFNTRDSISFNAILDQNCPTKITHLNTSNQVEKTLQSSSSSTVQNTNNQERHNHCKSGTYNSATVSFDTRSVYYSTNTEPFSNSSENHRQSCAPGKVMPSIQSETVRQKSSNEIYSTKKVEANQLEHNVSYECTDKSKNTSLDTKKSNSNNPEPDIRNNTYQRKTEDPSPYILPYEKSGKKMVTTEANILNDKTTSIPNSYPQQQQSFIATSNYEESALSRTQSTTTIAHNTSNFSILSWTTFSPSSGGNNNQFEQGTQSESTQKTICENFNYLPLHKESFTNTLSAPSYPDLQSTGFDKSRAKQSLEMQKRSYLDTSKSRNVRSIPVSQKQSRSQIQSQSQSQNQNPVPNTEYKYGNDNKNKIKYSADLDYMQNDYSGIDTRQQHGLKAPSQIIPPPKQDKSNYMMPDYGIQTHFDSESQQARYNAEIYNSNFKYVDKSQHQQKYQPTSQANILQHDNTTYNAGNKLGQQQQQQSSIKTKTQHQQLQQQHPVRPPVNWMMTPEIKHNSNITDIILPPIGKELDFCQNNLFSQTPTYNQSTSNQFYNNYDVTPHGFPNIPVLQSDPKRTMEPTFYPEEQPFSWSPTKNIAQNVEQTQALKSIDHQVVPSTLPTLVGDLALGTNLPDKQNFLFGQMPVRGSTNDQSKDPSKEKEGGREFQTMLNTQNLQHAAQGMSFLSVSQLVEHEKAEKNQHSHQNQQQQQQPRKHQRKNNTSPRNSAKRQIDIRKQTSVNEQLQRHEEHKPSSFVDQNYQQQPKYQQNDVHWRSRNCKSNYTAEALISTNTSVNETINHDKNSTKYTNYSQNKFPSSLSSTDSMMPINYFPNVDDTSGYGQVVNQNFNHSYGYSSNANIYPTTNFITSISNTPTNYMMSLHENSDYLEANNFLLPPTTSNITTPILANMSANSKNHQHVAVSKHQNCDKRLFPSAQKKGKRKTDGTVQNFEFPLSGITSPLDEYHHTTHFLPPHANPLYQNHPQANVYPKPINALAPPPPPLPPAPPPPQPSSSSSLPPPIVSGSQGIPSTGIPSSNPMAMGHHPSGTSLINFNLSTIFPEMNDKNCYKSSANDIQSGLVQSSSHAPTSYSQRSSYTNSLVHMTQVSDTMQFTSDVPRPPLSGPVHYKNP